MSASFWDKRAKRYDDKIREHDALYERMIDSTHSLLADSDVVLDFGCGSGEMSLDIAPHVGRVHGIDISAKMIELAREKTRQRHVDNVHFDQFDVFDEALEGGSYSAVVAFYIFHLLDDVPGARTRLND